MNSGRIAIGFIIIIALVAMFALKASTLPMGYALGTSDNDSTSASVTVNGYVSITLGNVSIAFPALDPGINMTAATNNAMFISIDPVTNTGVMIFLNGSYNFTTATDTFNIGNMSFNVTGSVSATANTSCTTTRCRYSTSPIFVLNDTKPTGGIAKNESIGHYIDVPTAQPSGAYNAAVRVCAQQQQAGIICA